MPTNSLVALFFWSFAVGFGAVVTPGPVSTAIVSQAPRQGWLVGPLIATGHSLMELLITILITIGLSSGLASPAILTGIALLGGLLLIWMGIDMLRGVWQGKIRVPGIDPDSEDLSKAGFVRLGILTTLSNPFWYAWWVTVAAGYLLQAQSMSVASVGAFYLGHISADYVWDTTLSTVIAGGKRWITDRVYRGIILVCALFFVYLGGQFLWQGIGG